MDDFKPQQPNEPTDKPDDFQATYENKPETYVTPAGEPTTLNTVPQPSLEIPKKKKSGAKKWLLGGLVVLLLAGLGAFAYWQWSEAESAKKELSSAQSQLETAQNDVAKLRDGVVQEGPSSTPAASIDDIVLDAAKTHYDVADGLVAKRDSGEPLRTDFKLVKSSDYFAKISFKNPINGKMEEAVLKASKDGVWKVIADGYLIDDTDEVSTNDPAYVYARYGVPNEYQIVQ